MTRPGVARILVAVFSASAASASSGSMNEALDAARNGRVEQAIVSLRAVLQSAGGADAAETRLALGNLLIQDKRFAEAAALLRDSGAAPLIEPYAQVLFVRAVAEGLLLDELPRATAAAEALVAAASIPDEVRERAAFYLVKLARAGGDFARAADAGDRYLGRWNGADGEDEILWLTGETRAARDEIRPAHERYAQLWHDHPASPWARPARDRMVALEAARKIPAWRPPAARRREFIADLQRIGLHEDALAEIDRYRAQVSGGLRDEALALRAASLVALRRNDECVRTAAELRRRRPRLHATADAALAAIKALRREDRTAQVRDWAAWVKQAFPGEPAERAQYDLAVHLANAGDTTAGSMILDALARSRAHNAADAIWKLAWLNRGDGRTGPAVERFRELLARFPQSRYRKSATYWLARFTFGSDPAGANALYLSLVQEYPRDYYGQEALRQLGLAGSAAPAIGRSIPFPPRRALETALAGAGVVGQRVLVLRRTGLYAFAAVQLEPVARATRDRDIQLALADLYAAAGNVQKSDALVDRYFAEFANSGSGDPGLVPPGFWRVCFPFPYRWLVERAVAAAPAGAEVQSALVAALIRRESGFAPRAISGVGAVGLMQLMPSVADVVARDRGLPAPTREQLFDPETNILLGSFEIGQRLREFGGELVPAICSYNAGVEAARAWWSARPAGQALDEFIETIPYPETRLYVKQVLADFRTYRTIYGQGG